MTRQRSDDAMNRDEFFALLDGLTEKEIEARLSSWDKEQLLLVQEYVDQKGVARAKAPPADSTKARPSKDEGRTSTEVATSAHTMAMIAIILSVGAMLAAMAAGFIAFVALRGGTVSW